MPSFPKPSKTKKVKSLKKNTKRKITPEVANSVKERDVNCIICIIRPIEEIHHAFYGLYAIYSENRNDVDQLVGLCRLCHDNLHSRGENNYREQCMEYLIETYKGK